MNVIIDLRGATITEQDDLRNLFVANGVRWQSGADMYRYRTLLEGENDAVRLYNDNERFFIVRGDMAYYRNISRFNKLPKKSYKEAKYLFNNKPRDKS
jgi:hypothetical protein